MRRLHRPRSQEKSIEIRGFSLVELSIVVAIISIVAVLGLETAANFVNRTNGAVTKERMRVIDDAIVRFSKIYGRLPCPANRTLNPTVSDQAGLEDCTIAAITAASPQGGSNTGGGLLFGAVPYRALNLPIGLSLDGFDSKINYAVTRNLTRAGTASGQFGFYNGASGVTNATIASNSGIGNIEIRSGILDGPCNTTSKCQIVTQPTTTFSAPPNPTLSNGAAYIIFSNGADRRGAVSMRGTPLANCVTTTGSDGRRVDAQNCKNVNIGPALSINTIPGNVFYDARFNSGLNLNNYFDDFVIWRTKAQL